MANDNVSGMVVATFLADWLPRSRGSTPTGLPLCRRPSVRYAILTKLAQDEAPDSRLQSSRMWGRSRIFLHQFQIWNTLADELMRHVLGHSGEYYGV